MAWHMHLGHICELSRKTKQQREKTIKNAFPLSCRHFPHYYRTKYYYIITISAIAAITAITILYCTILYCKPSDGITNTRYCPPMLTTVNTRTFVFLTCFPSGSSPFLLPAIPKHFCHPGLRHLWAGLPIRQTRDPTKPKDTAD